MLISFKAFRTSFAAFILRPFRHNAAFPAGTFLVIAFSLLCYPAQPLRPSYFAGLFFEVYSVAWLLSFLPKRFETVVQTVCSFLLYIVTWADAYCASVWGTGLSPTLLTLATETTPSETGDFLRTYLLRPATLRLTGGFLLIGALHAGMRWRKSSVCPRTHTEMTAFLIALVWAATGIWSLPARLYRWQLYRTTEPTALEQAVGSWGTRNLTLPLHRLTYSVHSLRLSRKQLIPLRKYVEATRVDTCSFRSPYIVLIIGESANKSHSSLYGYTRPTTPRISARAAKGEIVVFDDVVSGWNLTSQVFKHCFSLHSMDRPGEWCDATLFPALFRKAGYQVTFLTNQFVQRTDADAWDFSANVFLNDRQLNGLLFDRRNSTTYRFDDGLTACYDSLRQGNRGRDLIIFHLRGQHFDYARRTPENSRTFAPDDAEYTGLSAADRQTVADYDNATRYNDTVLNAILQRFEEEEAVVICLSDHGEAMPDTDGYQGRLPEAAPTVTTAGPEYDVPFWIWCSPVYRTVHADIAGRITASRHRPFMTDDLPHLLLYLGGIECSEYDETRNPIAPAFNTGRPRRLRGYADYDSLVSLRHLKSTPNPVNLP